LSRIANRNAAPSASAIPSDNNPAGPPRSRTRSIPPATTRSVPSTSAERSGSPSTVTAIAADITGPTPTKTAVRDGPITPTARVNRIWLMPGAKRPVTKNGHVSTHAKPDKSLVVTASTTQQTPARNVVTSEAVTASIGGWSETRIVTA